MARRADDQLQEKISKMVEAEQDPRARSQLMILLAIASLLADTVGVVRGQSDEFKAHRKEYEDHAKREENFFAQGRGAWRVGAIVLATVQMLLGYMFVRNTTVLEGLQTAVTINANAILKIEERNRLEERIRTQ